MEETFRERCVAEVDLWVKPGDEVYCFNGANETIGTIVLHCNTQQELKQSIASIKDLVSVRLR